MLVTENLVQIESIKEFSSRAKFGDATDLATIFFEGAKAHVRPIKASW